MILLHYPPTQWLLLRSTLLPVLSVSHVLLDLQPGLLIGRMLHQVLQHYVLLLLHYGLALEEAVEELLELHAALLQEVLALGPEGLLRGEFWQLVEHVDRE